MRKAPVNYIITVAVISLLWIGAAVFVGRYISENAALSLATPEEFGLAYLIIMSIGAAISIAGSIHWYWHGSRDSVAAEPRGARRVWSLWLFVLLFASVACVAGLIVAFIEEAFTSTEYMIMFGCASAITWIPYWICSTLMSPRGVRSAVYGMR